MGLTQSVITPFSSSILSGMNVIVTIRTYACMHAMYVKYMYVCVLYRLVSQRLQRRRLRSVQPGHIHLLFALALAGPVHLRPIWLAGGLHPVRHHRLRIRIRVAHVEVRSVYKFP
jgi:hypothetical protein